MIIIRIIGGLIGSFLGVVIFIFCQEGYWALINRRYRKRDEKERERLRKKALSHDRYFPGYRDDYPRK